MFKKLISMIFITVMLAATLPVYAFYTEQIFVDVPLDYWAYDAIQNAYETGAVGGMSYNEQTGERTYEPKNPIDAASFCTMIVRSFYPEDWKNNPSTDGVWWSGVGKVAKAHGLLYITSSGEYNGALTNILREPVLNVKISRATMAHVMVRLLEDFNIAKPSIAEINAAKSKIADFQSLKKWDQEDVAVVFAMGLISGVDTKGTFDGYATMTRAQAAAVYCRLYDKINAEGSTVPNTKVEDVDKNEQDNNGTTEPKPEIIVLDTKPTDKNESVSETKKNTLTNGKAITEANVLAMLEELKEEYPQGMEWGDQEWTFYSSPIVSATGYHSHGGCGGFAFRISDRIFGKDAPIYKHQNFDDLKAGDVIWIQDKFTGYSHIVVVMEYFSEDEAAKQDITAAYFTACEGNSGGKINWTGFGNVKNLTKQTWVYSRY